jgi:TRAP-type C4-dicarboxylate transport system permease small subunit
VASQGALSWTPSAPLRTETVTALLRLLTALENAMVVVACAALTLIVVLTAVDVGFRYGLEAPLSWAHDVVTQYLLIAMFFLSLPYVTRVNGHMSLDYLARRVTSPTLRDGLSLLGDGIALLVVAGMSYGSWLVTEDAFAGADVLPDVIPLPTWPSHAVMTLGSAVLAARLILRIAETLLAIGRGEIAGHIAHDEH